MLMTLRFLLITIFSTKLFNIIIFFEFETKPKKGRLSASFFFNQILSR